MINKRIILLIILILVVGGTGLFWSGNDRVYKDPTPDFFDADGIRASDKVVNIKKDGFEPLELTIKAGESVVFVNQSDELSWPASDPHPTHTQYLGFDPQIPMKPKQAWAFTFNRAGVWNFHDHLKPSSRGKIIVQN